MQYVVHTLAVCTPVGQVLPCTCPVYSLYTLWTARAQTPGLRSKKSGSCLTLTCDQLSHMTSSAVVCNAPLTVCCEAGSMCEEAPCTHVPCIGTLPICALGKHLADMCSGKTPCRDLPLERHLVDLCPWRDALETYAMERHLRDICNGKTYCKHVCSVSAGLFAGEVPARHHRLVVAALLETYVRFSR